MEMGKVKTVCVTGGNGFIGSSLISRLLQLGYSVKATVRDPDNVEKVKHLLQLPDAQKQLSLWKADLLEEGSFDEAVKGCIGVFHVANPMDIFTIIDPEDMIKPTVNGMLNVMRSCTKAKSVQRIVYTSTVGAIMVQEQTPLEYDESFWTNIDICKAQKMSGWMYFIAKTMAEKLGWDYSKESGIDFISIQPPLVFGPFITPSVPGSIQFTYALLHGNEVMYPLLNAARGAVHIEDLINAHIYLFENQEAKGRYICSSHNFTIFELARSLCTKYPDHDIATKFEGIDEPLEVVSYSSKKLTNLGFKFKFNSDEYDIGDLCVESITSCKEKGLL